MTNTTASSWTWSVTADGLAGQSGTALTDLDLVLTVSASLT